VYILYTYIDDAVYLLFSHPIVLHLTLFFSNDLEHLKRTTAEYTKTLHYYVNTICNDSQTPKHTLYL